LHENIRLKEKLATADIDLEAVRTTVRKLLKERVVLKSMRSIDALAAAPRRESPPLEPGINADARQPVCVFW
jgi:hypothetical protein